MRVLLTVSVLVLWPLAVQAQPKKDGPLEDKKLDRKTPVSYEKEIEPIFYKRCVTCHSGSVKESKLDIASYEGLVKGGRRGTAIVPSKGEQSLVWKLMGRHQKPFMPPKGEELATADEVALVKLWIDQGAKASGGIKVADKITPGLPPANVNPSRAVAVSPDKSSVAASRGNQIHIYDAGSGKHIRSLVDASIKTPEGKPVQGAAHISLVESMTWSPDGKWLVSGAFQEIAVWDALTGQQRHKISGFAHMVVALAFSQDSQLLAVAGGQPTVDGELKVFEAGSWKQIMDLKNGHSDTIYGASFSPDKKMIATCSADKFIKTWEVPSAKFVKSFEGHTHYVLDVGWSPDGKRLASAGADNQVKLWDFEKGEKIQDINAHTKQVTRLTFVGKKMEFVTCGGDNQVKFYNATNGGNLRTIAGANDFVYGIGVSPDGAVLAAGGEEGIVRLYNGTSGALIRPLVPPGVNLPEPMKK